MIYYNEIRFAITLKISVIMHECTHVTLLLLHFIHTVFVFLSVFKEEIETHDRMDDHGDTSKWSHLRAGRINKTLLLFLLICSFY